MAGDWIKMRTDLATDPAVADLAITLNIGEDLVVGKLHRFWSWVTSHFAEAILKPDTASTRGWIDRYVGLPGFVDAMIQVGWITTADGLLTIPHYDRHMSEGSKARALRTEQQKARRAKNSEAELKPQSGFKQASREEKRRGDEKWRWVLRNLTIMECAQPPALLVRYKALVEHGYIRDSEARRHEFFGFVALALAEGKDKPAMLYDQLTKWDTSKITNGYADEASRLLKEALYGK